MNIRLYLTIMVLSLSAFVAAHADAALIPAPQHTEKIGGGQLKPSDLKYIIAEGTDMPVLYGQLDRLPRIKGKGIGVTLQLTSSADFPSDEAYILTVNSKGAVVKAGAKAGLFYGAITLNRLLEEASERGRNVDAVEITDYPVLPVRAVHFDVKHHLDRSEYYYSLIDQLAQWKINSVIWEIEDKLRYERRPECAAPNAISKQEMRAISDYAKERNIEISPLVQGLGHAGFILKHHWELRENPESDWEFCPSNPETYLLQFDLYRDAMEAMPHGRFLHIGGDEISEIGIDQRCKDTGKTPFELQMEWLDKVCSFAKENGRTPIFWDDMPLKYGNLWWVIHGGLSDSEVDENWRTDLLDQAVDMFPKDCIYMRWHYDDPTIYPHLKVLDWYKNKGLRVMAATAAADGGSPYMPRYGSKIEHISAFCRLAVENKLEEGILATCWDDGSPHWTTVMRGFAALGAYSWNPDGYDTEDFKIAFERNYFGLYDKETEFIDRLEAAATFFDTALICEGRRNPAWQVRDYKLIDLPDPSAPGEWTEKYRSRLDSASAQIELCERLESEIRHAADMSLRNRYPFEIYAANNRLFAFPASLLKALECYDNAGDEAGRLKAKERIKGLCDDFASTKRQLIAAYGKTRFMQLPNGYIADLNHHKHLAALKPDADWLFLYEDDFVRKLDTLK
ncbi:MAG: beta-N-acetylhexosaminidase [Muribaculaceae bacterium]|nr:beta-N-acetylhexosaminidase [Muribaculaceae bacterium]